MTRRNTTGTGKIKTRLGTTLFLTTAFTLCGTITLAQTLREPSDTVAGTATMTAKQKKQQQMRKMQAEMAVKKRNAIPRTTPIYNPMGGFQGRNLKRADTTTCLQWRGGPQGTLMPMGMRPPPVPMSCTHGVVGCVTSAPMGQFRAI
ncbi:hypothetical protein [Thioclava indica]|uniref:Uncharacterized protein n=1 Tax=Thioclava indica TaxID=1353528 RepID=A0A074J4J1_9RHOB|nr:hypothetical protein [Thioclava indica]KEO52371.1 hypothetical protein DT23_18740 [Thioclava indica]